MAVTTAQQAAAELTQNESRKCGWLEKVSTHVKTGNREMRLTTYVVWATTHPSECPYQVVGRRRRHGRIKFISANVSTAREPESTYLGYTHATQRTGSHSNSPWEANRLKRQHEQIKIALLSRNLRWLQARSGWLARALPLQERGGGTPSVGSPCRHGGASLGRHRCRKSASSMSVSRDRHDRRVLDGTGPQAE